MEKAIALIGGGATSLAFIYHYVQHYGARPEQPSTIYLFEKGRAFGPGNAYALDLVSNLLNTKTGFITPFHDRPGDFHVWLSAKETVWRAQYPHFDHAPDSYAPRPLFGMYLQDRLSWLVGQAAAKGIRIVQIQAEVKDAVPVGGGYYIKTDCSLTLKADYAFLLCGTLSEQVDEAFRGSGRALAHPYPVSDLSRKIPRQARVAIVGARLSCIDAVVALKEAGHGGHIAIYSRSGYFPSVRGTQGRIVPRVLTAEGVDALVKAKGPLQISDLADLVRQEVALLSGKPLAAVPLLDAPPAPPACLRTFLREEIEAARGERAWQAVLYSTNLIVEHLWQALADDQKAQFLSSYFSAYMAYRVSIPAENAVKMLRYLEDGSVSFHAGRFRVSAGEDGAPVVTTGDSGGTRRRYDYVINAKGSPRDITRADSDLIRNLMRRGEIAPHRFGGIQVSPESYRVVDPVGMLNGRLRAVGELTVGNFFFTSALDINARHAGRCVQAFLQALAGDEAVAPVRLSREPLGDVVGL